MVVHPVILEVEARVLKASLGYIGSFKAGLGYMKACPKTNE